MHSKAIGKASKQYKTQCTIQAIEQRAEDNIIVDLLISVGRLKNVPRIHFPRVKNVLIVDTILESNRKKCSLISVVKLFWMRVLNKRLLALLSLFSWRFAPGPSPFPLPINSYPKKGISHCLLPLCQSDSYCRL